MHSSPLWLFIGALRALVISIRAIRVMPCYDLSGKPFMVIKSGHRMESSVPSSRELRLDYNHAPLTWTVLPFHLMSTAAYSSILSTLQTKKKERTTQHRNIFVHSTPVWLLLWAQLWVLRWIPSEEDRCQLCFRN